MECDTVTKKAFFYGCIAQIAVYKCMLDINSSPT